MKYLKVFVDFAKDIEGLTDTEAGRLLRAMLKYADTGEELNLRGAERILWPVAKKGIDNQRDKYAHICEVNKQNITNRYEPLRTATNGNDPLQEKEKDKEEDNKLMGYSQSFVPSTGIADDGAELERMIERLNLDLYQGSDRLFAKAIENAIRTMYSADHIRVNGRTIPQGAARNALRSLTIDHIDYILAKLEDQEPEEPVNNGQAYLISCIYNAPADFAVNQKRQSGRR